MMLYIFKIIIVFFFMQTTQIFWFQINTLKVLSPIALAFFQTFWDFGSKMLLILFSYHVWNFMAKNMFRFGDMSENVFIYGKP